MPRIDPEYSLRLLDRLNVKVDNDWLLVAPHQNAFQRRVAVRIDLLVRYVRRDIDEVAWSSFGQVLQPFAPAHTSLAANDIDDAFDMAVMVCSGFCVWVDRHGSCPDLFSTDSCMSDRCGAVHARRLWGIGVQLIAWNDTDSIRAPVGSRGTCSHWLVQIRKVRCYLGPCVATDPWFFNLGLASRLTGFYKE
jgi:hypothetical protein